MEEHRRSLAKAITWRATGSVDTFVLSWLLSGSLAIAGGIASTEVVTKMVLYYLHERAWSRISWGHGHRVPDTPARTTSAVEAPHPTVCAEAA